MHDAPHQPPTHHGIDTSDPVAFWDELYATRDQIWSGRVNPALAAAVQELAPGRALDLGSGEGGDAIWLAEHGWDVLGVDISARAIERAVTHAADAGVADRITWERVDLVERMPEGAFDLVAAQFLHSPAEFPRIEVLRRAAELVVPGGRFLVVGHATPPPWSDHDPSFHLPGPEEVAAELALAETEWDLELCAVVEREAIGPDGQTGTLGDAVTMLRRRS